MIPHQRFYATTLILSAASMIHATPEAQPDANPPRPPMVPLVLHNPHFCIWSPSDKLNESVTRHWTNREQPLSGLLRVDGKAFRIIGTETSELPALPQTSVKVLPTRTIYTFSDATVTLKLTFMSPLLPDDLEVLARPLTYITWDIESADGKPHDLEVYFAAGGKISINSPNQTITASVEKAEGLAVAKLGNVVQAPLNSSGDDHTVDWGHAWLAAPHESSAQVGSLSVMADNFSASGRVAGDDSLAAQPASDGGGAAVSQRLGKVRKASCHQLLAYDEEWAIQYFKKNLRPYWRRNGMQAQELLQSAEKDYAGLIGRCEKFDAMLMADAGKLGGPNYAYLCALAYRQCFAGNGLAADANGAPLLFPKENSSNGCISTVDVLYPMFPQFLLFSPSLAKAALIPALDYGASEYWPYNYAPHDLGQYPKANRQVYNMDASKTDAYRMPVEESANMILMCAAIANIDGNADFVAPYWRELTAWAYYLQKTGFDPANQLCTDDFAGHLAHNANLSIKAILALAAYGKLAGLRGDAATSAKYTVMAKDFGQRWVQSADDGDHYRLAFDKPGTWSMKYNLAWDHILDLGIFPTSVARKEMSFYRTIAMRKFGLPLDNRGAQTKTDWEIWCASLTNDPADLAFFSNRIRAFYDQVPQRRAAVDWYNVDSGQMIGFTARPVVGGFFLPFLNDTSLWEKYHRADKANPAKHIWAPIPALNHEKEIFPTARTRPADWLWTITQPAAGWEKPEFNDSSWQAGKSGFGSKDTPGATIGTPWTGSDIWLRRTFKIPANAPANLALNVHHDEDAEIYIDGIPAASLPGYTDDYQVIDIIHEAQAKLKHGASVTIAAHCHQTGGGQYFDLGIIEAGDP